MSTSNKMYKTKDGAVLGGVLKGLAEVNNLDVSIVRILTVVLALLTTGIPFLLIYFIMYLVLPDKNEVLKEQDDFAFDEDEYKY